VSEPPTARDTEPRRGQGRPCMLAGRPQRLKGGVFFLCHELRGCHMKRRLLLSAITVPGLVLAAVLITPARLTAQAPTPMVVDQWCAPDMTVVAVFRWDAPAPGAMLEWLDLSLFDNGFAPGTFIGVGPFSPPGPGSFMWKGIRPGLIHYYRLNTLASDGWHPSATGVFTSRACAPSQDNLRTVLGPVMQECDPLSGRVTAVFNWEPGNVSSLLPPDVQWVDLSLRDNGFAQGTFVGVGPLSGGAGSYVWKGLDAAKVHYWRVNGYSSVPFSSWTPSATGLFVTVPCGFNMIAWHYDAEGDDNRNLNDEYLTFQNTSDQAVDMTGYYIGNYAGRRIFTFPDGFVARPQAQVTIHSGQGTNSDTDLYMGRSDGEIWDNTSSIMRFLRPTGREVWRCWYAPVECLTPVARPTVPNRTPISLRRGDANLNFDVGTARFEIAWTLWLPAGKQFCSSEIAVFRQEDASEDKVCRADVVTSALITTGSKVCEGGPGRFRLEVGLDCDWVIQITPLAGGP
jgi:hypothetical protein